MNTIEIGTPVIHTRHDGSFIYEGDGEHGYTQISAHLRGGFMGIKCDPYDVAPATLAVPEKSPRVAAEKVVSERSYGPKMVWAAIIDGQRSTGIPAVSLGTAETRRDALAEAHRTMVIRDYHAGVLA